MKVLITGGAGFIGLHCVERVLKEGMDVIVVDNLSNCTIARLPEKVKLYKMNIEDSELEMIFAKEKPDYVVHLAAQVSVNKSMEQPYLDCLTNIMGTVNLLQNCMKYNVKKVIFASSAAVYGEPLYLPIDETHPQQPCSFYSLSKQTAEKYILLFLEHYGLNYCILRFANVYGPGQNPDGEAGVISIFLDQLLEQKSPIIFGGEQTRDFVYVKDVAEAVFLALFYEKNGTFNISTNTETNISDLLNQLITKLDCSIRSSYQPPREGEIVHSRLDNSLAMDELRWKVNQSLNLGLLETIEYRKEQKRSMKV